MKILKIEFENINSYKGHYCIDFTDEAYKKYYNQFVISGPTAAGKTTILDVITLALYGSTPRQARLTKTNNEVMNRESGYCMASLTYSCDEGIFCSTFRQNRANNKKDGNLQNPTCIVENVETGQKAEFETTGKLIEVTEANIHLTYDQFVRSILIPQGSFDKFLKSEDEEKAEILAKVSRTEHFKDIAACLWAEWGEIEKEYKNQLGKKADIDVLTEEKEIEIKGEKACLEKQVEDFRSRSEQLKKEIDWRGKADQAEKDFSSAEGLLRSAEKKEGEFTAKKETLRKAEKAGRCQEAYNALNKLEGNLKEEEDKISKAEAAAAEIETKLTEARIKSEKAVGELKKLQDEEEELKELLKKVREIDTRLESEASKLRERKKAYEEAESNLRENEEEFKKLSDSIADLTGQNAEHRAYLTDHEKDSEIESVLAALTEMKKNLDREVKAKLEAQKAKTKAEEDIDSKSVECGELAKKEDELKGRLFDLVDQNHVVIAGILRGKLIVGKPCPVCGEEYKPSGKCHEEQSDDSTRIAANVSEISEELDSVKEKHQSAREALKGLEKEFGDAKSKYDEAEKEEKGILSEINDKISPWGTELSPDYDKTYNAISAALTKLKTDYDSRKASLEEGEKSLNEAILRKDGLNIEKTKAEVSDKKKQYEDQKKVFDDMTAARNTLFGDKNADTEERRFNEKINAQNKAVEAAKADETEIGKKAVEQKTLKNDAEKRKKELEPQIREAEKLFRETLQKNDFGTEDEFLGCRMSEEKIEALKKEEKDVEKEKAEAEAAIKIAGSKLDELKAGRCTEKTAEELATEQRTLEQEIEGANKRIGECGKIISDNDEAKDKVANIDLELEKLAKEKEVYDVIRGMIGVKDGSTFQVFVQKIAMQNLIIKANEFMETLQPDKRLYAEEDSMDIMIREGEGDEMVTRPISNASGGETFCISLAMALAMAEFASENGGVDALFLDEGFGTLSGDPLMEAISSLKMLRKTGKLLGIITHVDTVIKEFDIELKAKKTGRRSTMTGPGVSFISETGEKKKTGIRKKG